MTLAQDQETPMIVASPITQARAWDRYPDEPSKWYHRFVLYRDMGPDRSIAEAYRRYRIANSDAVELATDCNAPSTWYTNATQWDWDKRAALFDDWTNRGIDQEIKRKVRLWRANAIDDLAYYWKDLRQEWLAVEAGGMSKNQIGQAIKTISREINSMLPQTTTGIEIQVILDKLPESTQTALLEALKRS